MWTLTCIFFLIEYTITSNFFSYCRTLILDIFSCVGKRRVPFLMAIPGNSTNIFWHECPVGKVERQKLLNQQGCVVWITGLSGSGL